MIIDTHSHLYDSAFDPDREAVVQRAEEAGVVACIMPQIDAASYSALMATARRYPRLCHVAMGLHPSSVDASYKEELDFAARSFEQAAAAGFPAVAVGEIGLDAYWTQEFMKEQLIVFEEQLHWAAARNLPLILHVRNAFEPLLDCLRRNRSLGLRGVLHAYSSSLEVFRTANRYGSFLMGIGGVLTFKNARLVEVVKSLPLESLLLETDAPWLTPAPFRGKRNESAYLVHVVQKLAEIFRLPCEEIACRTALNAKQLFNLPITL